MLVKMEHLHHNQKPMTAITTSELSKQGMAKAQLPKICLLIKLHAKPSSASWHNVYNTLWNEDFFQDDC